MDNKGFMSTMDSILALTVIFILLAPIIHIITLKPPLPSTETEKYYDADDIIEAMATYNEYNGTILEQITHELNSHTNQEEALNAANSIVTKFLSSRYPDLKYNLTENRHYKSSIASNGDMSTAENINSAIRNYGNYTFQLYIWY